MSPHFSLGREGPPGECDALLEAIFTDQLLALLLLIFKVRHPAINKVSLGLSFSWELQPTY